MKLKRGVKYNPITMKYEEFVYKDIQSNSDDNDNVEENNDEPISVLPTIVHGNGNPETTAKLPYGQSAIENLPGKGIPINPAMLGKMLNGIGFKASKFRSFMNHENATPNMPLMLVDMGTIFPMTGSDSLETTGKSGYLVDDLLDIPGNMKWSFSLPMAYYDKISKIVSQYVASRDQYLAINKYSDSVLGGQLTPYPALANSLLAPTSPVPVITGDAGGFLVGLAFTNYNPVNTDDNNLYWTLTVAGGIATLDIYKLSTKTSVSKVSSGSVAVGGLLTLISQNSSGISGTVTIGVLAANETGTITVTENVECYRYSSTDYRRITWNMIEDIRVPSYIVTFRMKRDPLLGPNFAGTYYVTINDVYNIVTHTSQTQISNSTSTVYRCTYGSEYKFTGLKIENITIHTSQKLDSFYVWTDAY